MSKTVLWLMLTLPLLWGADEAALKQRVASRAPAVRELVLNRLATEAADGLLKPTPEADSGQRAVVEEENRDRAEIFDLIAAKSKMTRAEVVAFFHARARKRVPAAPSSFGPCKLVPSKGVDVARLLQYLKQGINYTSQQRYDLAIAEFKPALAIDKNFLGLHRNIGVAQFGMKMYDEAEASLKADIRLVEECLMPLPDNQLSAFAYFLEVEEADSAKRKKAQAEGLKKLLPATLAKSQYSLASLYAIQKKKDPALVALRAAVKAGFKDKKLLASDGDFASVRGTPEFKDILAQVN